MTQLPTDPLLLQLTYVDESLNLLMWIEQFEHYHKRHDEGDELAYALAIMCRHCTERCLEIMVNARDQMEAMGVQVPALTNTE